MNSQNIFDIFGRQKKQIIDKTALNKLENNIDKKIYKIHEDLLLNQIQTERSLLSVKESIVEKPLNFIDITKGYIGFKNKRLVAVNSSIDKNDVVIRKELDNLDEQMKIIVSALAKNEDRIEKLRSWKKNVNETLQELLEEVEKLKQNKENNELPIIP